MRSGNRSAAPTRFSASGDGCFVVSLSSFTAPPASKWSQTRASVESVLFYYLTKNAILALSVLRLSYLFLTSSWEHETGSPGSAFLPSQQGGVVNEDAHSVPRRKASE